MTLRTVLSGDRGCPRGRLIRQTPPSRSRGKQGFKMEMMRDNDDDDDDDDDDDNTPFVKQIYSR